MPFLREAFEGMTPNELIDLLERVNAETDEIVRRYRERERKAFDAGYDAAFDMRPLESAWEKYIGEEGDK